MGGQRCGIQVQRDVQRDMPSDWNLSTTRALRNYSQSQVHQCRAERFLQKLLYLVKQHLFPQLDRLQI